MSEASETGEEEGLWLDELLALAKERGARSIGIVESGPMDGYAGEPLFRAKARLVTAEGVVYERGGYATAGDGAGEPLAIPRDAVESRAEARALRGVLKMAYGPDADRRPPVWQRQLQMYLRDIAQAEGLTREEVANDYRRLFKVGSTADLTQEQAELCAQLCKTRLSSARAFRRAEQAAQAAEAGVATG